MAKYEIITNDITFEQADKIYDLLLKFNKGDIPQRFQEMQK